MFERVESLEAVAARLLLDATPDQDDPYAPSLDPDGALLARVVELERLKAAADAEQMLLYAAMCRRAETWLQVHDPDCRDRLGPDDLVAAELAPALHLAPVTAAIRVRRAVSIATRLPGTLAAYRAGNLDLGRVLAISDATEDLSEDDAANVEATVLPDAVDQTAGELRAALRRAVITIDPQAAEQRRKRAVKDRTVERFTEQDGTSVLRAVLSAVDTGEIYDLIDETARRTKTTDDTRSMDARRADALTWLLLGRDPHLGPEDDPPPGPPPPERDRWPVDPHDAATHAEPDWQRPSAADQDNDVQGDDRGIPAPVVEPDDLDDRFPPDPPDPEPLGPTRSERISELAALALAAMTTRQPPRLPWVAINQTTGPDGDTVHVGELQGYGPITHEYAQHLLTTGAARPPPPQSTREPTPAQAVRHDPPDWLAREIRARDGTCRYPGCRQPTHRTDLDHVIPHPRGQTVRGNLGALCRRHHLIKGTNWWHVTQHDEGIYQWTSTITGATYTTHPRGTTGAWRGATGPPSTESVRPSRRRGR